MLTLYPAKINSPVTTLAEGITDVQTTVPLVDASVLPDAPNIAVIGTGEDAETILYTGKSTNTLTGVTREFQGTKKAWGSGTAVARNLTAYDLDGLRANLAEHITDFNDHSARHENGGADEISVAGLSGELADNQPPKAHAASHTNGTDDIQSATSGQKGLATATQISKLDGIEASAVALATVKADSDIADTISKKHAQGSDTALGAVGTKNPPIDADKALYRDSADSDVLVTSTWTQVKAFLKTYFDTIYNLYVHPNHSGDVTSVADGAQTIANDAVTYAKMQNVSATDKVLGRSTAGAGDPEEIACTAAGRALLDDADAAAQLVTLGVTALAAEINKVDNDEFLSELLRRGFLSHPVTASWSWGATKVGSGNASGEGGAEAIFIYTGATNSSSIIQFHEAIALMIPAGYYSRIQFSERRLIHLGILRATAAASCVARYQLKDCDTLGQIASFGLEIEVRDMEVYGAGYRTARGETAKLADLTTWLWCDIIIDHQPSVPKIDFYVDTGSGFPELGSPTASITATANVPQAALAGTGYECVSIEKGAVATECYATFKISQIILR